MIIVKGDITVAQNVTRVDGILVANNISAIGLNNTRLDFNGSLLAANNISFTRGYTTKVENNDKAAVVVNYKPGLIFNLPGNLSKILTNFRWGN